MEPMNQTNGAASPSLLAHLRSWLRGQRDPIEQQLADLAHQGAGMARIAHWCATLLVILFSAGSLVALGTDALNAILLQWQQAHGVDVPDTISVAVSTLMVLCMDTGLIYAASMLRVLSTRRANWSERWLHVGVMVVVSLLESGTYWYMSVRFERPAAVAASALIIARAVAAPLLAVYLSMARPLPITSRDILAQAEMASGAGVLRDVAAAANDRAAPLARKMRLYGASAVMTPADRTRLDSMIAAVMEPTDAATPITTPDAALVPADGQHTAPQDDPQPPAPDTPPTNGGTPVPVPTEPAEPPVRTPRKKPAPVIRLTPDRQPRKTAARGQNKGSNTSANGRRVRTATSTESYEAQARAAFAAGATTIGKMQRSTGMGRTAAASWVRMLKAEVAQQATSPREEAVQ